MMPAAKHGDPQIGVDIHLCVVPPSPSPVPLPTPHTSVVFDPFDYLPVFGASVTVCGMKRATAGTSATAIHIPPGFPFAPNLPDKDDEIFMGSATVTADGDPFSFTTVPTLSCQVAGMLSPPRLRKKGPPKAMLLPTTINLAIPTNVFVGGPPTISLMGLAFKAGFSALGKFARSGLFKRFRQWLFKGLDPGFLKCTILRAEPVNILSGEVSVEHEDFTLPGRIPIQWQRTYSSGTHRAGLCGYGWETPADMRIEVEAGNGIVCMVQPTAGPLFFDCLPLSRGEEAAQLELMDGALLTDHGDEFRVRTKQDRVYHFSKTDFRINAEGATEYPITRITDLCGNWLEFERRGGILTAINESAGRRVGFKTKDGRITEAALYVPGADYRHLFVRYEYDAQGDLSAVIDAMGNPYTFAYDTHHMVRHTDRNGLSFYYEYDKSAPDDWRVVHAFGDGGLYDYTFDYFDAVNERRITDSLGHTSTVKLNEAGLPISEIDPLGGMTIFEYDDAGRTTAVVDPDGHRTAYDYDERGNLLELTRPDEHSIRTEYDQESNPICVTAPNGAIWQQQWDARGLLVASKSPLGAVDRYIYDEWGQLIEHINPRKARTRLAYDNRGNPVRFTNALGHAVQYQYDEPGNLLARTDPLGHSTRYTYDPKGRLLRAELPGGAVISCEYDAEDNLVRYVDENDAETRLEYCGLGEIKRRIQPDGHSVEYHYDTEEHLLGLTNQRGETYHLKRDPLARIIEEIDYWGQSRHYTYSGAGHIQQSTDPLGRTIDYKTDPLGRIRQKILPHPKEPDQSFAESSAETFAETFDYDENGNLAQTANPHIKIARRFDPEGRLLEENQGDFTIQYAYDENGNRTQRITSRGNTIAYTYDDLDQITAIHINDQPPITIEHDARGQITRETLTGSLARSYTYDPRGRLTGQTVKARKNGGGGLTDLFQTRYSYDLAGNLTERSDSQHGIDKFAYDPMGRIFAHLDPTGKLNRFLHDPAGDLLSHLPDSQDGLRTARYENTTCCFDAAGNLAIRQTADKLTRFEYDPQDRLKTAHLENGTNLHMAYDALGRRCSKSIDGVCTFFTWDGDALLSEQNENGQPREYVYYPGTFEPLAVIEGINDIDGNQKVYYYHNDLNGLPGKLTKANGDIVWSATYDALGRVEKILVDDIAQPLRLQGQYYDSELGLCYNRYRYFDPQTCSFTTQDPIGLAGGKNVYAYAPNVWGWVDPLGLGCKATKTGVVDPAELRWSQTTAGGRGRADVIRQSMAEHGWKGDPIDVVETVDGLATLDHTRAAVALEQGIKEVPVRIHLPDEPLPADMLNRPWNRAGDTANTWGEALQLRGAGQSPPIGPTGSPTPPILPKRK